MKILPDKVIINFCNEKVAEILHEKLKSAGTSKNYLEVLGKNWNRDEVTRTFVVILQAKFVIFR